jgi:HEAT repeat protein
MLLLATAVLSLVPQGAVHGRPNSLVLPKPQAQEPAPTPQAPRDALQEMFHRRALELRRSLHLPRSKEDALLRRFAEDFDRVPERALLLLRTADADLGHGLLRLLQTFGRPADADELRFLLLTRTLGDATRLAVETMAMLAGPQGKDLLFECLTSSRPQVRKHAEDQLVARVSVDDEERLSILSRQERDDIRVKSLRLLGGVPTATARARLVTALAETPMLAEAASLALLSQGEAAVDALREIVQKPAVGRSFGYACLVLALLEERLGTVLFDESMRTNMVAELTMPDPFQRAAVAIGMAGMAWRSTDTTGTAYADAQVVHNLVHVVSPGTFVSHLALLQDPAQRRLEMLTGKAFGVRQILWREWWTEMAGTPGWVGSRQRVAVTAENAGNAVLEWRQQPFVVRFRGERVDGLPSDALTLDHLLTADEMRELVAVLEGDGFMGALPRQVGASDGRRLELHVGGAVSLTPPDADARALERLARHIDAAMEAQSWQLYRDPEEEPDIAAFWRAERRWRAQHPDAREQRERLERRILAVLPRFDGERLDLALRHLTAVPDLRSEFTAEDGRALVAAIRDRTTWDERAFRIMELALLAPGDEVWRELLAAADSRSGRDARLATARMFSLLGPERLVQAAASGQKSTRLLAIDELSRLRDQSAVPTLLAVLREPDDDLRVAAAYCLGVLRTQAARKPLLDLLAIGEIDSQLRRTTWVALARIGGPEVFEVLKNAFLYPDEADRRAVIQALGALRHPDAARQLGEIFLLRGDDMLGQLAFEQLRQQGDLLASPVLRDCLEHKVPAVRRQVLLVLAEFQDPAALPGLIAMLADDHDRLRVVALIAGITGQDLTARNDRLDFIRAWYTRNRVLPQQSWFLAALAEADIKTSLRPEQVGPGAGTAGVPELVRLMLEAQPAHLKSLAARLLRVTTGQDFGTVGPLIDPDQLRAIADRYAFLADSAKAAAGR